MITPPRHRSTKDVTIESISTTIVLYKRYLHSPAPPPFLLTSYFAWLSLPFPLSLSLPQRKLHPPSAHHHHLITTHSLTHPTATDCYLHKSQTSLLLLPIHHHHHLLSFFLQQQRLAFALFSFKGFGSFESILVPILPCFWRECILSIVSALSTRLFFPQKSPPLPSPTFRL